MSEANDFDAVVSWPTLCKCGDVAQHVIEDGPLKIKRHRCTKCYGKYLANKSVEKLKAN